MAQRQKEFNDSGARVYGLSADTPAQNAAVMEKLVLTFPLLSDVSKDEAVRPLGFDDEKDPRKISKPGVVVITPDGEVAHRYVGRDYADRPDEDELLEAVGGLGLDPVDQSVAEFGHAEPGERAMPREGLGFYFNGAKFAALALRRRHREVGQEFTDDTKAYVQMIERYLEALAAAKQRRG